ncbi:MAG: phosphatase PAP2 family protein [Faecalimonas sp.]|nr:phosphatase PAP2 family protein [Faecalimonas sp.]
MKKPVVDYREFRLSKLNDPRFSHLKLLGGWLVYFALYFLTENLIPAEKCYPVHSFLDDVIPFCEWFVIPYVFWYVLIVISLVYFALYNIESFKNLSKFIIITQLVAMAIYILFPTRQDLRPEMFANDNILTRCVGLLYRADTNTGVCPSLHVAYSIGIASVWLKEKGVHILWKTFVLVMVILICLSTMFIKQHSAVDFFAALPVCALAEWLVFYYKGGRNGRT